MEYSKLPSDNTLSIKSDENFKSNYLTVDTTALDNELGNNNI